MNTQRWEEGYIGAKVADAVAMPVHWYYNTALLDRDYGQISEFVAPKNSHPDSILWRSSYQVPKNGIDLLEDQARFWGAGGRGVHYHQLLGAGENTLNFKLASELYNLILENNKYEPEAWLERYIERMSNPAWHRDTYIEEYHRAFFTRLAQGKKPDSCGIDDNHIGGLSQVPALCAALVKTGTADRAGLRDAVAAHVQLTHRNAGVLESADVMVRLMVQLAEGNDLEVALREEANGVISLRRFEQWSSRSDREVVGQILSPACYIDDSFPASLYLSWKYRNDFSAGVLANAQVGGDNCHRGGVVGALLGLINGVPAKWREGLAQA